MTNPEFRFKNMAIPHPTHFSVHFAFHMLVTQEAFPVFPMFDGGGGEGRGGEGRGGEGGMDGGGGGGGGKSIY